MDNQDMTTNFNNPASNYGAQGIFNDQVIINNHIPLQPTPALHQLRPSVADFIGRTELITQLLEVFRASRKQNRTVIVNFRGMGGIGKTELAYHITNELLTDYPDAQLFIDLRGSSANPITPAQALQQVISAFLPEERLASDLPILQSRYRSLLHGKRALIFVDDAKNASQIRPLIPPSGCALIITSRLRFTIDGGTAIDLGYMNKAESIQLLQIICPRLTNKQASDIAEECGALPLALRISASILANNEALSTEKYLSLLKDEYKTLSQLKDPDDNERDIESIFQLSYNSLDESSQLVLRHTGLLSYDADMSMIAAITGLPEDDTEPIMQKLLRHNLAQFNPISGRWSLHELLRAFSINKLRIQNEEHLSRARMVEYVIAFTKHTHDLFRKGGEDEFAGLRRFSNEYMHIIDILEYTYANDMLESTLKVTSQIWPLWEMRGDITEGRRWMSQVLSKSSDNQGDPNNRASTATGLGALAKMQGDYSIAHTAFMESLSIYTKINDTIGIARSYNNLGQIALYQQNLPESENFFRKSLALLKETEDSRTRALVLCNLGMIAQEQGKFEDAEYLFIDGINALKIDNDITSEAMYLESFANTLRLQGKITEAYTIIKRSLEIHSELEDEWGIASANEILGLIALDKGDLITASAAFTESLQRFLRLEDTEGLIWALEGIAKAALIHKEHTIAANLFFFAQNTRSQEDIHPPSFMKTDYNDMVLSIQSNLTKEVYNSIQREIKLKEMKDIIPIALAFLAQIQSE